MLTLFNLSLGERWLLVLLTLFNLSLGERWLLVLLTLFNLSFHNMGTVLIRGPGWFNELGSWII